MGVRLQRHLGTARDLDPGQYTAKHGLVSIRCPLCGGIDTLGNTHDVDPAGRVTPAYACPTETCPWLDFVDLDAWGEQ